MADSYDSLKIQLSGLQRKYSEMEALNQSLNKRLLELYALYQISLSLSKTFNPDDIFKSIKRLFQKTFRVDHFGIFLLDESLSTLNLKSAFGLPEFTRTYSSFKFGHELIGQAVASEQAIYIADIQQDQQFSLGEKGIKSGAFLVIPILIGKNRPIGAISIHRKRPDSFSKNELGLLKKIGQVIARVLDKILLFQHTKELSITDDLTGLYNRRYFNQRYEREFIRAKRYKRPLTVLMIDIDHFKSYNDINGHLLGDEALKKVAASLELNLRKADIVARYGGEEFVILLPEIDKANADQVAEKLRRNIEGKSFPREQYLPNKNLTISIGLATFPDDSHNSKELLELADRALYQAKTEGRNRVISYQASMIPVVKGNILHMEPKSIAAGE